MNAMSALPPADLAEDFWSYIQKEKRPIVVYGMGNGGDKLVSRLSLYGVTVADFFASDGFVRGQLFHGKRVLSLADVEEKYKGFVILVSFGSHLSEVVDFIYRLSERHEVYIPDMPLAGEEYFDAAFYRTHYDGICRAYELLADETSKRLFADLIRYKLTASPLYLKRAVFHEDEKALLGFDTLRSAIDVGAYRGDTLRELFASAPCLKEVYAVEPDRKNFAKLKAYSDSLEGVSVSCYHAAAWDADGSLSFAVSGNRNAAVISKNGQLSSHQHKTEEIKSVKIDTIAQGRKIDYIKFDTEGAESEALRGSINTIRESAPALLVSAYHRSEDLFCLLLWLAEEAGDQYDFYFRRHNCIPAWDMNLLAIPKKGGDIHA